MSAREDFTPGTRVRMVNVSPRRDGELGFVRSLPAIELARFDGRVPIKWDNVQMGVSGEFVENLEIVTPLPQPPAPFGKPDAAHETLDHALDEAISAVRPGSKAWMDPTQIEIVSRTLHLANAILPNEGFGAEDILSLEINGTEATVTLRVGRNRVAHTVPWKVVD